MGENVILYYTWWNGATASMTVADTFDLSTPVMLTENQGSHGDGKIYTFKYLTVKTPYDTVNNTTTIPNLFPNNADDVNAYWMGYDWNAAIAPGMDTLVTNTVMIKTS